MAFELISAGARSIIYSDKLQKLLNEIGKLYGLYDKMMNTEF